MGGCWMGARWVSDRWKAWDGGFVGGRIDVLRAGGRAASRCADCPPAASSSALDTTPPPRRSVSYPPSFYFPIPNPVRCSAHLGQLLLVEPLLVELRARLRRGRHQVGQGPSRGNEDRSTTLALSLRCAMGNLPTTQDPACFVLAGSKTRYGRCNWVSLAL